MARLVGVDLPREKRVEIALTYIYGIGRTTSKELLAATGVDGNTRVHALSEDELVKLAREIESRNLTIEGDLRREVQGDIRRKIEIGSYQGRRHPMGLPVRGQRTKTNARTRKGPKRTAPGKKKAKGPRRAPLARHSARQRVDHRLEPDLTDQPHQELLNASQEPSGCGEDQGPPQGEEE